MLKRIEAGVLHVAYLESGPADGKPVLLLHGFPYDVHAYEIVSPILADAGCRVITPYLRGYGLTRFLSSDTPRSGQQAALAHDLVSLMDALRIENAVLGGYDWGGRAACIVAALWPDRVHGLVSGGGYNIQDIAGSIAPQSPESEMRLWYQYYFHSERGRVGLQQNRRAFCKLLWQLWSPGWQFDHATFERSASAFDNPDFVEVVIHSYRHRFGLDDGDPAYQDTEHRLTEQPSITVPTVVIHGNNNGVIPEAASALHDRLFGAAYERRVISEAGHNLPQEVPRAFAAAVLSLV